MRIQVVLWLDGWNSACDSAEIQSLHLIFCIPNAAWVMFSGFPLTGLPELPSTSPQSENYKTDILKTQSRPHGERQTWICVCVCVWMEKVKGRWSSTMGPLHEIHLRLIPAWNPHISHASAGKTTALKNRFSSRKFKTSEAQFPLTWQLWFPSWMVEQRRQTGSGRTSLGALVRPPGQTNHFAAHRAFCMMLLRWPEMRGFFFSHWESLMQRYYLWAIMCPSGSRVSWFGCVWRAGQE